MTTVQSFSTDEGHEVWFKAPALSDNLRLGLFCQNNKSLNYFTILLRYKPTLEPKTANEWLCREATHPLMFLLYSFVVIK